MESLFNGLPLSFRLAITQHKNTLRKTQTLVGRSLLIEGLKYLNINYKGYNLSYKGGKPYLSNGVEDGEQRPLIHFNISHSRDTVVCALSKKETGIDVEYCNKVRFGLRCPRLTKLSEYTLSSISKIMSCYEIEYVSQHKNPLFAFYKLWTRKEAVLKCLGIGISFSELPKVDVLADNISLYDKNIYLDTTELDKDYILSYAFVN